MADNFATSGIPRKRKFSSQESNETPSPIPALKRKTKRKDKNKKLSVVPQAQHRFRAGSSALSPLKISHIQDLILFTTLPQSHPSNPKWCQITKISHLQRLVIVCISGVGAVEYANHQECFPQCNDLFKHCVETKAAGPDVCVKLPHESLLSVNLPKKELKRIRKELMDSGKEAFDREDYILTIDEMSENDFPLPAGVGRDTMKSKDDGYVSTKSHRGSTESTQSPMLAIDCEMCLTAEGMELTRISLVDEWLNVLYDTLVKPSNRIIDYKTEFSGITADMLENVTTTLADVQQRLIDLLPPDAILLGHSLENDLRALKLYHRRVIDTSVLYTGTNGAYFKASLRSLAKQHLKKKIQDRKDGHCSIEDAAACMELVQLKIKNGPNFGAPPVEQEGLFERTARYGKIASMLDYPGIMRKFSSGATHTISCRSDEEIVSNAVKLMQASEILWAHLHEAEMFSKEHESNVDGEQDETWKDVLRSVDSRVKQIHDAVPRNSLVLVILGCGNLSLVKSLQRQKNSNKTELKEAVKSAKKGICFMRITS